MEYFEKVAAYEDEMLYDLAEDEAYDLAYEKTAATRFKELMNDGSLNGKSVGRLNDLGYLNPKIRKDMQYEGNTGLALPYKKTLFGKHKPLQVKRRELTPEGYTRSIYHYGPMVRRPVYPYDRQPKLEAAKDRNAMKVTNRWAREMANANGGHLTPGQGHALKMKSLRAFGSRGQL